MRRRENGVPYFFTCRRFRLTRAFFVVALMVVAGISYALSGSNDVPAWAKQAVWYQIFPDRFRNGDPKNDPTVNDLHGSWPHEEPKEWRVSSWTSDWYRLQPWEEVDNKGFYFRAQQRRYGGDLQGVIDKLDYLQSLGINAIYFNPLFESPSLHKYDASTYHHIDGNFGPNPEGDRKTCDREQPADAKTWEWTAADKLFLRVIQEAHRRKISIIIDGVFHCTGSTFWAFEDLKKNQAHSPYKDWYVVKRWDDPATAPDEFDYEGWFGVRELPELRETQTSLADGPKDYIQAVVRRWMDPNGDGDPSDGIDGWRLDAAEMVPAGFWGEFRTWVKAINPDAYLVAELWWEDWQNDKIFNAAPWLQGDKFDAVMNYRWAREVVRFFTGDKTRIGPSEFDKRLRVLQDDYPTDVNYGLMNLIDSHDTDRLGSMIVNKDSRYDHNIGVADNRNYNVRKPNADEISVQKLIALFQMTYVGAPVIYYGDEAGMWGADDPDERKPMLWPDMKYDNESHHPFGLPRPVDENVFNHNLHDWYKQLMALRRAHPALSLGSFTTLKADDAANVFAYERSYNSERLVVVINNSPQARDVTVPVKSGTNAWMSALTGDAVPVSDGFLKLLLQPKTAEVVVGAVR